VRDTIQKNTVWHRITLEKLKQSDQPCVSFPKESELPCRYDCLLYAGRKSGSLRQFVLADTDVENSEDGMYC